MYAIEVVDVYKNFKIHVDKGSTLKEKVLFRERNTYREHEVLKGVDLKVKKGEVVGLIGRNGCGKSTLLKLMTKIIYPNKGEIKVVGKVSSLLELGAGFHPDMTGRENIYTNASIFGLTKKEIDERLEEIIAFSELGEFIDNPVRTYSSGMYMRLAFSVAINVDAEVLLVDEILAVGDAAFQDKCFKKMSAIKEKGTTIVIVSHDLGSIQQLCDRAIWINEGKIEAEGTPKDIIKVYLEKMMGSQGVESLPNEIEDSSQISFTIGKYIPYYTIGDVWNIQLGYECKEVENDLLFNIYLYNSEKKLCYKGLGLKTKTRLSKQGTINISMGSLALPKGNYVLVVEALQSDKIVYRKWLEIVLNIPRDENGFYELYAQIEEGGQ